MELKMSSQLMKTIQMTFLILGLCLPDVPEFVISAVFILTERKKSGEYFDLIKS